ncbi:MAG TPA: isoaspartyl peptidase/L-asparaginase [Candidatus Limnocylindria bacterium]|nr:isoaspartyl peptidase/L-asparaginase [Candidatus Limnocylindria bacterium]
MAPPRAPSTSSRVPALIIHGGAGADPGDSRAEVRAGMRTAVDAGWRALADGGTSLDAVEAAVRALEDHPRFNAGRGSALTSDGMVEMDASIMEGDRLVCGAVACVSRVASAVTLARRVLDEGRHVLFVADGAHAFARAHGLPLCDPATLVTEGQRRRLAARLTAGTAGPAVTPGAAGTVGAVAIDRHGTVAAATSTGGMMGKHPGRVGDSALIGCGTYADSTLGAVSCTGDGEAIIRVVLARRALEFLKEAGDPDYAAHVSVNLLVDEGRGEGGLILVDWRGRVGYAHSTPLMPVAWMSPALAEPSLPF